MTKQQEKIRIIYEFYAGVRPLQKKVFKFMKEQQLTTSGQKVVVAVSGGPDSLSLMHLLQQLSLQLNISLHIVHVNHQLRPEARKEEIVVKKWALILGLPITVCRIDVRRIKAQQQASLQAAARAGRYAALTQIARCIGATAIATAHHLDDRAETLLLRLLSGCGLEGLKGIPLRRSLSESLEIIRPFYNISRKEIEAYCLQHQLTAVHDPTNNKSIYLRNRIRLQLIPFLEAEFGSHVPHTLAQTAAFLAQENTLLAQLTDEVYDKIAENQRERGIALTLPALRMYPLALQSRLVRKALWEAGVKRVDSAHISQIFAVINSKSPSAWCPLPDGITATREYLILRIAKRKITSPFHKEIEILVPGRTLLPWSQDWIEASFLTYEQFTCRPASRREAYVDADKLLLPLTARVRKAGDRVHLFSRPGERKLKDILIDKKMPRIERDRLALVISGEDIVWVTGIDIAQDYCVSPATKRIVHFTVQNNEE